MERQKFRPTEIFDACFEKAGEHTWACKLCADIGISRVIKQDLSRGYSNVSKHATSHGAACEKMVALSITGGSVGLAKYFGAITDKARNIYGWLDVVIMCDFPLSIVENQKFLNYSKLTKLSRKTLDKYLYKTLQYVQNSIKEQLPDRFGLIFDGWSCDGEHYIAIFATYVTSANTVVRRLLACGVQDLPLDVAEAESFGFTAEDIGDYFSDVLRTYDKTYDSIQFITADNAAVNGRLCQLLTEYLSNLSSAPRLVPLVGCASHRLNLAVQAIYNDNGTYSNILALIDDLMRALNTQKNRPKLSAVTSLCPETRNLTRWGSTFNMLEKYLLLKPFLAMAHFDPLLKAKIVHLDVYAQQIENLRAILRDFEAVSQYLQSDSSDVNLMRVRQLFDGLIQAEPKMRSYLAADAPIVHDKIFERAVVKLQRGDSLSAAEASSVQIFKIEMGAAAASDDPSVDFVSRILNSQDDVQKRRRVTAQYQSTAHVSPTSNICERLFSRAKLVMTPHRRLMDPSTLEAILMLRMSNDLWDEVTIQKVILNTRSSKAAEAQKKAQQQQQEEEGTDSDVQIVTAK